MSKPLNGYLFVIVFCVQQTTNYSNSLKTVFREIAWASLCFAHSSVIIVGSSSLRVSPGRLTKELAAPVNYGWLTSGA